MKTISEIESFGYPSAERDDLERFFISTPVFDQLLKGGKSVVLGKKGSGKTALYRQLIRTINEEASFAVGLNFKGYPWKIHAAYVDDTGDSWERYQAPWRFLIYITIISSIATAHDQGLISFKERDARKSLAALRSFLETNYGTMTVDFKKAFPQGGLALDGIRIAPSVSIKGASVSAGDATMKKQQGSSHGNTIHRLNEWLWNTLRPLAAESPRVVVLFDELDAGFDPTNEDYIDRVVGLLLAVRQLAFDFKEIQASFSVIAFLRTDIYDYLKFGDKAKITQEDAAFLQWHDKLVPQGNSLKKLIDFRIRKSLAIPRTEEDAWAFAFDSEVMRGTQHKFHHMTTRSYLRPRDVIQFSNFALKTARARLETNPGSAKVITNVDMTAARLEYSNWFLSELDDEIGETDKDWQINLLVLRRIHYTKFASETFRTAHAQTAAAQGLQNTHEKSLEFLYRYNIIGFEHFSGAAGGNWHFRYQNEQIRFNPEARSFQVHWALKEALDLKDTAAPVIT